MATTDIANAKLGMDVRSIETALPRGAMRDIVNFDITDDGTVRTRAGATLLGAAGNAHSLWSPRSRAFGLYAQGATLRKVVDVGGDLQSSQVLAGLTPSLRVKYFEHADDIFFTNNSDFGVVRADGTAGLVGVPSPTGDPVLADAPGGMAPGLYSVAFSYLDALGQESALSRLASIESTAGGIAVTLPPAPAGTATVRLYATTVNGDLLYQVRDIPAGFLTVLLQDSQRGKAPTTQGKARLTGGSDVSIYNGVAFISQGPLLRYSEPFYFGITDLARNFISFGSPILFHEPVADGIYVGTEAGTYFLGGTGPGAFTQRRVGSAPVVADSITMPASQLDPDLGNANDGNVAVWLSTDGFVLGFDGGAARAVQEERISLARHGAGSLVALAQNGIKQVVSLVEATLVGNGSAKDSLA